MFLLSVKGITLTGKERVMKIKKMFIWYIVISLSLSIGYFSYKRLFKPPKRLPYTTARPTRQNIKRVIETTGKISVAEKIKVGSLVAGIVKKLHIDENQWVTKGQLLAEIDTGKDDAEVKDAEGGLEVAKAVYEYNAKHYLRQKTIFEAGQLAENTFDEVTREYLRSRGEYKRAQAALYVADRAYKDTRIVAPQDGVIISVGIAEGERVTTDLDATILCAIARDITKMEAYLEINEGDVGHVLRNQKVKFTVDSFPNKIFKTNVREVSYSPVKKNGHKYYEAIISIDNSEKLLRPGFSVDAAISIAKAKNALAVSSHAFMISRNVLKEIAKDLNYAFYPISDQELHEVVKREEHPVRTAWVVLKNGTDHSFAERIVTTNVTDDIYHEVVSGLTEDDEVIVGIEESNYLEEILKKTFKSGF